MTIRDDKKPPRSIVAIHSGTEGKTQYRAILAGMNLLQQAKIERDKLNKVIALLEGTSTTATTTSTSPKKGKPGRKWTDAEKKAMSVRIKALNAAKRRKA